jgi:hypothetical protein
LRPFIATSREETCHEIATAVAVKVSNDELL